MLDKAECLEKRREHLASARKAEHAGNEALGSWHRLFATNFDLMASADPVKRARGMAALKQNGDRFERDIAHPELGERLRGEYRAGASGA